MANSKEKNFWEEYFADTPGAEIPGAVIPEMENKPAEQQSPPRSNALRRRTEAVN